MADLNLGEELYDHLIAQGIGQANADPPSLVLPSLWVNPRDGAPGPRPGEGATITIVEAMEVPRPWLEGRYLEEQIVHIRVRARTHPAAKLIQRQIRGQLEEKKAVFFGQLRVEWSKMWRGDQEMPEPVEVGKQDPHREFYTREQSFRIACRVKSLAGQPYAP